MVFAPFAGEEDASDGDRQESEDLAGTGENTYHHVRRGDGQQRRAGKEVDSQCPHDRSGSEAIEDLRSVARGRGGGPGFCIFQDRLSQFVTYVSWPGRQDPFQVRSRSPTLPRDLPRRLQMPVDSFEVSYFSKVSCREIPIPRRGPSILPFPGACGPPQGAVSFLCPGFEQDS